MNDIIIAIGICIVAAISINSRKGEVELYADINRIEQGILKIKRASRNRKTEEE